MTHLAETNCRCGVPVMHDPVTIITALCMDCRRQECGVDWPWLDPVGDWHPSVGYPSPGLNDHNPHAVTREPFPAPQRTSRDAGESFPAPAPVLKLAEYAREHGWEVRTQYAQGHVPHGTTGKPGALRDSIALRFGAHPLTDRQAYACYERAARGGTWAWDGIMVWGPDLPPYAGCGLEDLRDFLHGCVPLPTENMHAWVNVIKHRRAQAAGESKERTAFRAAARKSWGQQAHALTSMSPLAALLAAVAYCGKLVREGSASYTREEILALVETRKVTYKEGSQ